MKTLFTLARRNMIGFIGAFTGTMIGYLNGGRLMWVFIVPPALLIFMMLLEWSLSKGFKAPVR